MKELNALLKKSIKSTAFNDVFGILFVRNIPLNSMQPEILSGQKALQEFYSLAQALLILILHKMNIEHQMGILLGQKDILAIRHSLRHIHKDEKTYYAAARKEATQSYFLKAMVLNGFSFEEEQEAQRQLQTELKNPLHSLDQVDPRLKKQSLILIAQHLTLGDSYDRVETYCRAACKRLTLIEPFLPAGHMTPFKSFHSYCAQAASLCRNQQYTRALLSYLHAMMFVVRPPFAPMFDFAHNEAWRQNFFTLTVNIAKIYFHIANHEKPIYEPIKEHKLFWHAALFNASVHRNKDNMTTLLNWERKQYICRFFKSFQGMGVSLVTMIADYASDHPNTFKFPSENSERSAYSI